MILFCPRARSERAEENRKVRSLTAPHPFHLVALQFATSPLELLILYSLFSITLAYPLQFTCRICFRDLEVCSETPLDYSYDHRY